MELRLRGIETKNVLEERVLIEYLVSKERRLALLVQYLYTLAGQASGQQHLAAREKLMKELIANIYPELSDIEKKQEEALMEVFKKEVGKKFTLKNVKAKILDGDVNISG